MTRKEFLIMASIVLVVGFFGGQWIHNHGVKEGIKRCQNQLFTSNSSGYTNGNKLDLPEELSQVPNLKDSSVSLLYAYKKDSVIYLGFSGWDIPQGNHIAYFNSHGPREDITVKNGYSILDVYDNAYKKGPCSKREYELDVDMDNFTIYDGNRIVGVGEWCPNKMCPFSVIIDRDNL